MVREVTCDINSLIHGRTPDLISEGRDVFGDTDCNEIMSYILGIAVEVCPEYVGTIFKEYNYSLHRLFQTGGMELIACDWSGFIGQQEYEQRRGDGDFHVFVIVVKGQTAELYNITEGI